MLTPREVLDAIVQSWRLFKGDRTALQAFDASYDGFWRSFTVIVALAPFYALVFVAELALVAEQGAGGAAVPAPAFFLWKSAAALVDWIAFPAVVAVLAGSLNISGRYALLIVARNWTSILAVLPYALVSLLYAVGLMSTGGLIWSSVIVLVVLLRFRYQVFAAALGGPSGVVVGLVVLDFLLSVVIGQVFNQAIPAGP